MKQEEKRLTGLEEEIIRFNMVNRPINHSELGLKQWGEMVARHFYELGKQSGYSEIPNELEEAAVEWSKENTRGFVLKDKTTRYVGETIDAFIAGAKWQEKKDQETIKLAEDHAFLAGADWQKEQMMKEAVEGEITKDNRGNNVVRAGVFNKDFEYGDKVRIIVIPKEDGK